MIVSKLLTIANEFKVSIDNIKCIIKRKTWRHI